MDKGYLPITHRRANVPISSYQGKEQVSAFNSGLAENMSNPEFAYEYGRTERELEIIKLLEEMPDNMFSGGSPLEEAAGAAIRLAIRRINGSLGDMRKIK